MVSRAHDGHRAILRALRDGQTLGHPGMTAGQIRGYRKSSATLQGWGCIADGGLTDQGHELIRALEAKWGKL